MLNKKQFDLLDLLAEDGIGFPENTMAEKLGYSVETIEEIYKEKITQNKENHTTHKTTT